jgi:type VII secretion integral membrane protein EccD
VTDYTRVTVQGEGRKADLVLPDDEPIAAMLPEVLALLDEGGARSARPVALMTTVGDQLDPSLTLAEQAVHQGTILRVVRVDEAPPPPEVADVTDIAADAVQSRGDVWRPVWGVVAAAVLAGVLGVFAARVAVGGSGTSASTSVGSSAGTVAAVCAALTLVATLLARRSHAAPAVVGTAAAVGALGVVAQSLADAVAPPTVGVVALVWFGLSCLVVGVVGALGFADVALGLGGGVGALLVAALAATQVAGWEPTHAAAAAAVIGTLLLGLLPGIAMTASGLSGLDDRIVEGRRVPRVVAHRAVDTTHRALTWATVATSVVTGAAAWSLAGDDGTWGRLLAAAVGTVVVLRARLLPLAPQRLAVLAAGIAPWFALLVDLGRADPDDAVTLTALVVVVLAVVVGRRVGEHALARLRRLASVVELVAVLSLVPLLLAHLGVFADLVGTF